MISSVKKQEGNDTWQDKGKRTNAKRKGYDRWNLQLCTIMIIRLLSFILSFRNIFTKKKHTFVFEPTLEI